MAQNISEDLALTPFVFVYGTLKRGFSNNCLLKDSDFVFSTLTKYPKYVLYNIGIPYLSLNLGGGRYVSGEVYKVDKNTLENLDVLEGVEYNHYQRNFIRVGGLDNFAWAYYATQETLDRLPQSFCPIEKGSYTYVR